MTHGRRNNGPDVVPLLQQFPVTAACGKFPVDFGINSLTVSTPFLPAYAAGRRADGAPSADGTYERE